MNPNLCRSVKNCSLPSAFVKISASWYCVGTYEGLIIPASNFSRQCGSLSQCVLCVHEILGLLLYVMPLDCHKKVELASYMAPLNPTTDIATKLSSNKYWPSCDILLLLMILIRLYVFLTSMR